MYRSRIKDELDERYSKDGYYALGALVLVFVLILWAGYETAVLAELLNSFNSSLEACTELCWHE